MKKAERNHNILEKILVYCGQIDEAMHDYGDNYAAFTNSSTYRNAVCMCILQIGELAAHLSDDFKNQYNAMPWQQIKGMRNFFAHKYQKIDIAEVWDTMQKDIPALRSYCEEILQSLDQTQSKK